MSLTAPPRVDGPVRPVIEDAVIEDAVIREAKRRARRRRRIYGGAVAVVLALVGAFVAWDPPPPPAGPPPAAAADGPSLPAGGPSRVATRVAAWGQVHWGWVIVYGDARVLLYADFHAPVPDGALRYSVLERYLTPAGLDRVRTGTVALSSLFPHNPIPANTWADPEFTVYAPSDYAVCPHIDQWSLDLTTALRMLPAPMHELLQGTQRMYTYVNPAFPEWTMPPGECFTLAPKEARIVVEVADDYHETRANALDDLARGGGPDVRFIAADGTVVGLHIAPVMPDGQGVVWGG